jgi:hypothetical protein
MQNDRRWIQLDRAVADDPRIMPTLSIGVIDRHHVVGVIPAETGVGQYRFACFIARRICGA